MLIMTENLTDLDRFTVAQLHTQAAEAAATADELFARLGVMATWTPDYAAAKAAFLQAAEHHGAIVHEIVKRGTC